MDVFAASAVLALVPAIAPALPGLEGTPRSVRLSTAGGISVAYCSAVVGHLTGRKGDTPGTLALFGGVLLNVIREEVPSERRGRFRAFALGATGYTVLLLVAWEGA